MLSKEVKEEALRRLSLLSKADTARFVMVTDQGIVYDGGGTCHVRLSQGPAGRVAVVTAADQPNYHSGYEKLGTKESKLAYVDYLLNRSPFSQVFTDKDAELCFQQGGIEVDGNQPSNLMAGACVATRYCWERYGGITYVFSELSKNGVPEDLAFFLSQCCSFTSMNGGMVVAWGRGEESHYCMEVNWFTWKCLHNLMSHTPTHLTHKWTENPVYQGINKLYISHDMIGKVPEKDGGVLRWILSNIDRPNVAVENNNPFPIKVSVVDTPKYEKASLAIDKMVRLFNGKLSAKLKEGV